MTNGADRRTGPRRIISRLLIAATSALLAYVGGLCVVSTLILSGLHPFIRGEFNDPATRFDPELGWAPVPFYREQIPGWGSVTTNSMGFRSPELVERRDKVLILGDSVAWGYGVDDAHDLSSRLQSTFAGEALDIVNMAVAGYGPDQEYVWLARNMPSLRKDKIIWIVLIVCVANDLDDVSIPFEEGRLKPLYRFREGRLVSPAPLKTRYGLTNLIGAWPHRWSRGFGRLAYRFLFTLNDHASKAEGRLLTEEFWRRMNDLAGESGARFAVVLSPSVGDLRGDTPDYAWYKEALSRQGYLFLDFKSVMSRQQEPDSYYLHDGIHYTPKGNELLAHELRMFLSRH